MDAIKKHAVRSLLRAKVVPAALAQLRSLRSSADEADTVRLMKWASEDALAVYADDFPALSADEMNQVVTMYAGMCAEAFEGEYHRMMQPREELIELAS